MGFELDKVSDTRAYRLDVTRHEERIDAKDLIYIEIETVDRGSGFDTYANYPLTREEALALAAHLTGLASTILRDQEEAARK
jgi:hypothetical protein